MIDPVGAHTRIADSVVSYIRTAFGTRFPNLEDERERLLRQPGAVYQEPWIEPLPRYESSGKTIADIADEDVPGMASESVAAFRSLASCGLVGDFPLHRHQLEMLTKAISGHSCVITAGTGSGKTEAFLLPVFAYLVDESASWDATSAAPPHLDDWWRDGAWREQCRPLVGQQHRWRRSLRVPQRGHERRSAAVRALVVYPMNALVEDQLSRMRRALDSTDARAWFAANRNGNRVYFGRYNGLTPVPGHEYRQPDRNGRQAPDGDRIDKLATALDEAEQAARIAEAYSHQPGKEDVRYFFPSLYGAEMRCRWDMQDAPPDILITNFSMLSIMLMRDADKNIFDRTAEWLQRDGSVFHLVVDELHLYRGTAGTEVAYLLRLLLDRLGLEPGHPKLKVLASSASLEPNDPASLRFLSEFFGTGWLPDQIVPGYPEPLPPPADNPLDPAPFAALAEAIDSSDAELIDNAADAAAAALGGGRADAQTSQARLSAAVDGAADDLAPRLINACVKATDDGPEVRAVPLSSFATRLFGEVADRVEAARGLLYARGIRDSLNRPSSLPSFRLHWFFRNVEGLWACTSSACGSRNAEGDGRTAGPLFLDAKVLCNAADVRHRVLELLYCEQCGTTLFGGTRMLLADNAGFELLTTDPDIEGIPDRQAARFVERRTWNEFAVFWPSGQGSLHHDARGTWNQPILGGGPGTHASWPAASLDPRSGRVRLGLVEGSVPGHLYQLTGNFDPERVSALPARCPSCGRDYSSRLFRKSPIRGFRTGFSKLTQLLSKELFYLLPGPPSGDRKLVLFSDSREEAASLANGVERAHYLDLVREALYDELATVALGEPELLEDLEMRGEPSSPAAMRYAAANPSAEAGLRQTLRAATADIPELDDADMRKALEDRKRAAEHTVSELRTRRNIRTVPIRLLFEDPAGDPTTVGALVARLETLGVNPAGNDVLYQDFSYDGSYHRWTQFFDWTRDTAAWRVDLSPGARTAREDKLRAKVISEICGVLFSRLYFGFESAGLGYVRLDVSAARMAELAAMCGAPLELFEHICEATVRVMGAFYRYPQEPQDFPVQDWPDWQSARAGLRNFVGECAAANGLQAQETLRSVRQAI